MTDGLDAGRAPVSRPPDRLHRFHGVSSKKEKARKENVLRFSPMYSRDSHMTRCECGCVCV